jgi:single stranded DNA-binding protein
LADLNLIVVTGVATKDAVLRHRASGVSKAEFSLEVSRPFVKTSGESVSDLFLVDVYGPLAERCADLVQRGRRVVVVGTLNKECYITRHGRREHMVVIKAKYFKTISPDAPALQQVTTDQLKSDHWNESLISQCIQACGELLTG